MRRGLLLFAASLAACSMMMLAACSPPKIKQAPPEPVWPTLPLQKVPDFMRGTLYERVRFSDLDDMRVYGYSLVVNLNNTGDSRAPTFVRDYIMKQMYLRGFGSYVSEMTHANVAPQGTYANVSPEEMLRDKRVAIVTVEGRIPVGARQGQSFDIIVHTLEHNNTTSLAHGVLYEADLSDLGLIEPQSIGARQQAYTPGGPIFVNPAYGMANTVTANAMGGATTRPQTANALRVGRVLNGGVSRFDRPITMQLRNPQASTARRIETLISQRWDAPLQVGLVQGDSRDVVAKAENEGLVLIYVPPQYRGDWKHFLGVVSHIYLDQSAAFQAKKLRQLADLAVKPGAPLADISLCWEAMGESALPMFQPLISDPDPDVAFAAARAAAFLGDGAAREALVRMALDPHQHNQIEAVRVLGELPDSPEIDHMIAELLNSDRADVRIEAYRMLVSTPDMMEDSASPDDANVKRHYGVITRDINHKFLLDIVPSSGPPLIYATSTGVPRIAIIGHDVALQTPLTFTAMDMRLSISSSDDTKALTIFYRDPFAKDPEHTLTQNDLPMILARLGGMGPPDPEQNFNLSFADVVAVAEQLVAQKSAIGMRIDGTATTQDCAFELEHPSLESEQWTSIPTENREGRPQGGGSLIGGGVSNERVANER
jgi:hypothetical protein